MLKTGIDFVDIRGAHAATPFCQLVSGALAERPKRLPTRFLYDRQGSELFERITELPEYYPTRTERWILQAHADQIVEAAGERIALLEFGSGSSIKTRLLIEAALRRHASLRYVPIDISADFLKESAHKLAERYAGLQVTALAGEYFDAAEAMPEHEGPRLILFLGSNIGNFEPPEAARFLRALRANLRPEDRLLIGADLVKDRAVLEAAYDDSAGVTAEFNRNLLRRVNRELDGQFDPAMFLHAAPYDERHARIEMRLVSAVAQQVPVERLGRVYDFEEGEYIHTEWSHKYTPDSFAALAVDADLTVTHLWTDPREWFALFMLRSQ